MPNISTFFFLHFFCTILNCFDIYALEVARGDFETARSTLGEAVERNGETRLSEGTKRK